MGTKNKLKLYRVGGYSDGPLLLGTNKEKAVENYKKQMRDEYKDVQIKTEQDLEYIKAVEETKAKELFIVYEADVVSLFVEVLETMKILGINVNSEVEIHNALSEDVLTTIFNKIGGVENAYIVWWEIEEILKSLAFLNRQEGEI